MVLHLLVVLWSTLLIITETETRAAEDVPSGGETTKPTSVDVILPKQLLDYVGCYADDENRKIQGQYTNNTQMTSKMCVELCKSKSFVFAGVQAWFHCFCGNETPDELDKRPESDCQAECPGDKKSKCGGDWRNSVYRTGANQLLDYVGCYADDENRKIRGQNTRNRQMTPQMCVEFCKKKSYMFAGVQAWTYCFCGNETPDELDKRPETGCYAECPGDKKSKCGGDWRNSVYRTGANYMGCYADDENRKIRGENTTNTQMTPQMCVEFCKKKSYMFAGVQAWIYCFCGNEAPDVLDKRPEIGCYADCPGDQTSKCGGDWRNSVYRTGAIQGTLTHSQPEAVPQRNSGLESTYSGGEPLLDYMGCYVDDDNRKIRGENTTNTQMTVQMCVVFCKKKSYMFAGVQAWIYCFCGNETPDELDKRPETGCQAECPGDKKSKCGGNWRNSVYRTGAKPLLDYMGCYFDDDNRKIRGENITNTQMTAQMCVEFCKKKSYMFAGVQAWTYCFCGNETPDELDKRPETGCQAECPGDKKSKCGGNWRNSVYRTGAINKANMLASCQTSLTTVNNQHVCAHAVVFEEHFDEISQKNWKHFVQIQSKPVYPFVIYNSRSVNSFTLNSKLVIKPTFLADDQVRSGDLQLAECTGERFSNECRRKAVSYNILPPVQTARLTTRNSFAFRYGKVEITAKLPLGDWLVPELWLEPTNDGYYSQYSSRRIRIAMSRGNSDLTINGQDLGCKQLESSVIVSTGDNIKTHAGTQNAEECWYKNYHNYTLMWTPENMIFSVDGGQPQSLIPNGIGTLADIIGYPPGVTPTYTQSSIPKIAPFDTEFYITVGLSAGGMLDFPDNSVNRGKPKPWRNFELKALLNFWRDKNSWKSTWQEDTALLQIDHIQVTAL